jgi:ferrous iron transport protein A
MNKRLTEIAIGKQVVIKHFENDELFLKLMEMGLVPGELIQIEKIAPLGDPICIKVSGYTLSLRIDEAEGIIVEEEPIITQ